MNILKSKPIKTLLISIITIAMIAAGILYWFNKDVPEVTAGWWNDNWNYRKAIVINNAYVTGDLTDFPALISLTDTNLGTHAQADGDDIIFIDKEGKKLSHEIESFATSTGVLVAWVKIPSLSSTQDTPIYMYYGNASVANQQDAENVWDENYRVVWHLAENGVGTRYDSTRNSNDGTPVSYDNDEAVSNAKINGADNFDGSNDRVYRDVTDTSSADFTISLWAKADATGQNEYLSLFSSSDSAATEDSFQIDIGGAIDGCSNQMGMNYRANGSNTRLCIDTYSTNWQYVTVAFNASVNKIDTYFNGAYKTSVIDSDFAGLIEVFKVGINRNSATNGGFDGSIDEFRISNIRRSTSTIETSFNNQNSPATFLSVQSEEVGPGPVGYWSFDTGYGATAYDESGQGNNGTITGAVWQDESMCVSGKCLWFDGTDDYIDINTINDEMDNGVKNAGTFSAWVNRKFEDTTGQDKMIFNIFTDNSNALYIFYNSSVNLWSFRRNAGGVYKAVTFSDTSVIPQNTWTHIAISWAQSGADEVIVYINGIEKGSFTGIGSWSGILATSTLAIFQSLSGPFHGFIDEVKVYPYARSADQIKQDYAAGLAGIKSNSGVSASFGSASD